MNTQKIFTEYKDNKSQGQQKHKIACKNCSKSHHKCDKIYPSCSHCLKKNIKCEVNPSKKRGRPYGSTKNNKLGIDEIAVQPEERIIKRTLKPKQIITKKIKMEENKSEIPLIIEKLAPIEVPNPQIKFENLFPQEIFDKNWEFDLQLDECFKNEEKTQVSGIFSLDFNDHFGFSNNLLDAEGLLY